MGPVDFFRDASGTAWWPIAMAAGIVAIVGLAVLCQFSLFARYRAFHRLTLRVARRLGEHPAIEVRGAVNETLGQSSPQFAAILLALIDSAATRRGFFHPDAAVEAIDHRENQILRAAFVRWVSSAALVMGLAGTFMAFIQLIVGSGLLEALATLSAATHAGGSAPGLEEPYTQLSNAFGNVYHALGYAFLSSLAGLLGTLLLGFIGAIVVQPGKARALVALEKFAEGLYAMVASETDQSEKLSIALTNVASSMESSGQTLESLGRTSELLETAARGFEGAGQTNDQMVSTLTALTSELQTSQQKWDVLVEAFRESKQQVADVMQAFRNEAAQQREKTQGTVAAAVSEMRDITKTLCDEIRKVSAGKMDQFISIQEEFQRILLESKRDWEKAGTEMIAQTTGVFENTVKTVSEMADVSRNEAGEARQGMAELARQNLEAVKAVIADTRGDADKAQQAMSGVAVEATKVVTQHETVLAAHAEAVAASLQQWSHAPAALEQTLAASAQAIQNLTSALDRMTEMPARWENNVLSSIRQLEGQLHEAREREEARKGMFARWWATLGKPAGRTPGK